MHYAGLTTQLAAGILLAVYAGIWLDKRVGFTIPLFIWLLPLLFLIVIFIKVIWDTSKK